MISFLMFLQIIYENFFKRHRSDGTIKLIFCLLLLSFLFLIYYIIFIALTYDYYYRCAGVSSYLLLVV